MTKNKMIENIYEIFWYPHLKQLIHSSLPSCILCLSQKQNSKRFLKIGKFKYPSFPRQMWSIDLSFGLNPIKGYVEIAVFLNIFL